MALYKWIQNEALNPEEQVLDPGSSVNVSSRRPGFPFLT